MKEHKKIFPVTRLEEKSGYLLYQVNMLWQRKVNQGLKSLDLTHTQFIVLASTAWMGKEGERVHLSDISTFAHFDRMMTSRLTDKLSERNLLKKIPGKQNAKIREIKLTPTGIELLKKAIQKMLEMEKEFYGPLGEHHQELNKNLEKLLIANRDKT